MGDNLKNRNRTVLLIICIIIIAILATILCLVLVFSSKDKTGDVSDPMSNQNQIVNSNNIKETDTGNTSNPPSNNNVNVKEPESQNNQAVQIDRKMAVKAVLINILPTAGHILTARDGDVSAPFIGMTEFSNKLESFIPSLVNKNDIIKTYIENNVVYAQYEAEFVLDVLGYSAHNNVGITSGLQTISVDGIMNERNSSVPSEKERKNAIILALETISPCGDKIFSALDGDVSAPIIGKHDLFQREKEYADILMRTHNVNDIFKIYKKDNKVYCEYEVEKVINALGYSSHMGVGIPKGLQTVYY